MDHVAERLGGTQRYMRRLATERRIRYVKVGHLLRFSEDDLNEWIKGICTEGNRGAICGRLRVHGPTAVLRSCARLTATDASNPCSKG